MMTLHGRASKINISLSEALAKYKTELTDAVAILYSPSFCKFAKFENGTLSLIGDYSIYTVFEARVFNQNVELRWLNISNGLGRAVLISDIELTNGFNDDVDVSLTQILDTIPQQYLLWGKGVDNKRSPSTPQGWSRLAAARIGALDVPIADIQPKQQVKLIAKEYIGLCEGKAGEYGNVAVLEERLIGLELEPLEVKS
jgi:CRISPR-associated protein (TIGR03984 family)